MTAAFANLPFDEAIDFLKDKVALPTETWTDLWEGMHSRAFVAAGAMRDDLLSDIQSAVLKGISEGTSFQDFKKEFTGIVSSYGWKGSAGAPITDKKSLAWRAGVIFNTNLRTAFSAGAEKQMQATATARPYARYIGGLSRESRRLHREWSGTILPLDDPWWDTHTPPNGWGCKCKKVSVSARELRREGWKVDENAPEDGAYKWKNPRTGETVDVPNGIDPGWAYNPGTAKWGKSEALRAMEDENGWSDFLPLRPGDVNRPAEIPTEAPPIHPAEKQHPPTKEKLLAVLKESIGGDAAAYTDPKGGVVRITDALVDHMLDPRFPQRLNGREAYFPFLKNLIEDPYEIWIGFEKHQDSGRVRLRKRYVKGFDLGKKKSVSLVADEVNGQWVGLTTFNAGVLGSDLKNVRKGRLFYGK